MFEEMIRNAIQIYVSSKCKHTWHTPHGKKMFKKINVIHGINIIWSSLLRGVIPYTSQYIVFCIILVRM